MRPLTDSPRVTSVPGKPLLLLGAFDIAEVGCVAEEFFVSGTASAYLPTAPLGPDGQWSVTPCETADYTTRLVVVTPADRARFNGTVLVEWLNVSGGIDAPAVWMMAHREIVRAGYGYVAVSAQRVGVEGGAGMLGADMSLKSQDPARYAPLHHPGDAFCYDIFSQVAGLLGDGRDGGGDGGAQGVLRGLDARHVIAVGESQSAMFLTTYVNAVDPLARAYDGFLVHSRFGPAAPLDGGSIFEDSGGLAASRFRADLRVPLVAIITETDLLGGVRHGYYFARQPDTDRLRVWEIPGAAHADNYTIQVAPIDDGSGLFGLVHGLRRQFPLLDRGRAALTLLHETLGAGCSMSKIGEKHLTTVDAVGHGTDGEHAVGQRFPIDPPFGLVAMAWRDDEFVRAWLHRVMPRLGRAEIAQQQRVLADIRARGYGAWRFDDTHQSLHHRLADVLASLEPTARVTRQLTTLMTMVTLQSVTDVLETALTATEFVVLPIFGQHGQPEYQIEIHLGHPVGLTLEALNDALRQAQRLLTAGVP